MSYQDDMKTATWQKRRLMLLERDNWKCKTHDCKGQSSQLEIHHIDYIPGNKIWEYPDDMLITLCRDCHSREQERDPAERMLINSMRMKGFMVGDVLSLSVKIDNDARFTEILLKVLRGFQNG